PLTANLDVGLVQVPLARDGPLAAAEALQQLRREADDPAVHGGVIDAQATFGHHLFQITQAEIVGKVPAHAQQDHRAIEMTALEHDELLKPREPSCPRCHYRRVCDRTPRGRSRRPWPRCPSMTGSGSPRRWSATRATCPRPPTSPA